MPSAALLSRLTVGFDNLPVLHSIAFFGTWETTVVPLFSPFLFVILAKGTQEKISPT